MSANASAFTAMRVADRLRQRTATPWEVFGERARRFELHLSGERVEMRRAPVLVEGYGLRLFRPTEAGLGIGGGASTDLSDAGVDAAVRRAEEVAPYGRFPARRIELPSPTSHSASVEVVDRRLWDRPVETLEQVVHSLLAPFEGRRDEVPSFGSVRATLGETTLANSEGLQRHYPHATLEFEFAVKSSGGPEGPAPGEYWVNPSMRRVPDDRWLRSEVERWCRLAREMRGARSPSSGATNVILPPSVLADILPAIVGFRLSGAAHLRKMMPAVDSKVGADLLTVHDHGLLPFGLNSAPFDDEGVPQARRPLIERGTVRGGVYDLLHASALQVGASGNGRRDAGVLGGGWFRFHQGLTSAATNLEVAPGSGGSMEELAEAAGEGIWVDQLGYAFPDPLSGSFGGELRAAYRVRNGKVAEPLRGGTVGGIVFAPSGEPSLLTQVRSIGSRAELVGTLSTGPWWVADMMVGGS